MKKLLTLCLATVMAVTLVSWGYEGHQAVGLIAERHLTPKAKAAVHNLLGSQSMADVASWADEVRNQEGYKHTYYWHFLNPARRLNKVQFEREVKAMPAGNGYTALLEQERVLKDPAATQEQKIIALKFLIHIVGDLHQPMHLGTKEDQGGNLIHVLFEGDTAMTNLHSVWDSKLINREGLSATQLAGKVDNATPGQIYKWQQTTEMQWIWESYSLCSFLYNGAQPDSKLPANYYDKHINIVHTRLEQAGIRLAGLLNTIFDPQHSKRQ